LLSPLLTLRKVFDGKQRFLWQNALPAIAWKCQRGSEINAFYPQCFVWMATMNVHDLYEQTIKSLSAADRLRLAVLILNNIPPQLVVDDSENWAEADLQEFTQASWQHIDQLLEDDEHA
jgi:hypothetical protein